jgi:hypothetical protein
MRTKVINDFVKAAMGMAESPGKPGHHVVEERRITCPTCRVGWADFTVKIYKSAFVGDFEDPKKCCACNAWIRCKPRVVLEGVAVK